MELQRLAQSGESTMHTRFKRFMLPAVAIATIAWSASFALNGTAAPTANLLHLTPALVEPIKAAQDAIQAQPPKLEEALAKLREAEANPEKTAYDEHVINAFAGAAYARLNDYPDAEKAFAAQVDDGFTRPADLPRIVKAAASLNYKLKNYARAAEFGTRALAESADDDDLYTIVSQAYYLDDQYDAVRKFLGKRIDSLERQGRDVPPPYLQLIVSACTKLQDSACVSAYSKRRNAPRRPLLIDPELKHDSMLQANANSQ
jgi:tetratricopeptide (TPR) repeat protein